MSVTAPPTGQPLRDLGELVFGMSWLNDTGYTWPDHYGELERRAGLCARPWAKNPRTPITAGAVAKAGITVTGTPRSICINNGSAKLDILAQALHQAVTDGIPDQKLAAEATRLVGNGTSTGLQVRAEDFTKNCDPANGVVPVHQGLCHAAAKLLVPILDTVNTLEADWATAIS